MSARTWYLIGLLGPGVVVVGLIVVLTLTGVIR